jgi:hypothetical protein
MHSLCRALFNYVFSATGNPSGWRLVSTVAPPAGEIAFRSVNAYNNSGVFTLYLVSEPSTSGQSISSNLWSYVPATSTYTLVAGSFAYNTLWKSVSSAPYDSGANPSPQPTASFGPTSTRSQFYSPVR